MSTLERQAAKAWTPQRTLTIWPSTFKAAPSPCKGLRSLLLEARMYHLQAPILSALVFRMNLRSMSYNTRSNKTVLELERHDRNSEDVRAPVSQDRPLPWAPETN
jgi:hypothetical protein